MALSLSKQGKIIFFIMSSVAYYFRTNGQIRAAQISLFGKGGSHEGT